MNIHDLQWDHYSNKEEIFFNQYKQMIDQKNHMNVATNSTASPEKYSWFWLLIQKLENNPKEVYERTNTKTVITK